MNLKFLQDVLQDAKMMAIPKPVSTHFSIIIPSGILHSLLQLKLSRAWAINKIDALPRNARKIINVVILSRLFPSLSWLMEVIVDQKL